LSIRDNVVPPILNLDNLDEECKGLNYVSAKAQEAQIDVVLSNSFGFGGTNATLIFKSYTG
jgi:3-oxoacyl-[acyl-carrier-protein] synthase II